MTRKSFSEVQLALQRSDEFCGFRCIGTPKNLDCTEMLGTDRIRQAQNIVLNGKANLTLKDVNNISRLMLCLNCQYNSHNEKDKIEAKWSEEFQNLGLKTADINWRRGRSRYSLYRKSCPQVHRRHHLEGSSSKHGLLAPPVIARRRSSSKATPSPSRTRHERQTPSNRRSESSRSSSMDRNPNNTLTNNFSKALCILNGIYTPESTKVDLSEFSGGNQDSRLLTIESVRPDLEQNAETSEEEASAQASLDELWHWRQFEESAAQDRTQDRIVASDEETVGQDRTWSSPVLHRSGALASSGMSKLMEIEHPYAAVQSRAPDVMNVDGTEPQARGPNAMSLQIECANQQGQHHAMDLMRIDSGEEIANNDRALALMGRSADFLAQTDALRSTSESMDLDENVDAEVCHPWPNVSLKTPPDHRGIPGSGASSEQSETAATFTRGIGSRSAPWTLCREVLELLWEPLPEKSKKYEHGGSIYVAPVATPHYGIVKIGITSKKTNERVRRISNEHGVRFDTNKTFFELNIPGPLLERLEKLVHKSLAFWQRDLISSRSGQQRVHAEYFEIDLVSACKTIYLWLEIAKVTGLASGQTIHPELKKAVQAHPDMGSIFHATENGLLEADQWGHINKDYQACILLWRQIFRLDPTWTQPPLPYANNVGAYWSSMLFASKMSRTLMTKGLDTWDFIGSWLTALRQTTEVRS